MTINKYLAALILTFGLTAPALAGETPANEVCSLSAAYIEKSSKEAGVDVRTLTDNEVKALIDKKGPPPNTEGKVFTVLRVDMNGFSKLFVVVDGCVVVGLGPAPSLQIDNLLNENPA